jgi:hypothetical protein
MRASIKRAETYSLKSTLFGYPYEFTMNDVGLEKFSHISAGYINKGFQTGP